MSEGKDDEVQVHPSGDGNKRRKIFNGNSGSIRKERGARIFVPFRVIVLQSLMSQEDRLANAIPPRL